MALMDLKSDLSWYGKTPPAVDNFTNRDAQGFTTDKQQLNPSRFIGIAGGQFSYTGNQSLGILGTTNYFTNDHNEGFTLNIMPRGSGRPDSQFLGISGNEYESTSLYGQLSNLSNLSRDVEDTKFLASGDSFSREISGFDFQGNIVSFRNPTAIDALPHDPYSNTGDAKRSAQLGGGTKFPISYNGDDYEFDKPRLGFTADSTYEDIYGKQANNSDNKNAGLANTYTAESPIDDMYNRFNLRDDATPNPGYVKQPFILRGIQRADNSDPQRWGIGETTVGKIFSTFDLPRAGILTSAERSAIDAVRIGKFLISPKGIGFLARQFGYQLMNPNTENLLGNATKLPKATQIYNPLSAPGQALVGGLLGVGKFTRHTGLTNLPLGGGGEYEGTKNLQRAANILVGMDGEGPLLGPKGRMLKLYGQYKQGDGFIGQQWAALTAPSGPGSILGIGATTHTRRAFTDLKNQRSPYGGIPGGFTAIAQDLIGFGGQSKSTYETSFGIKFARYNSDKPYEDYPKVNDSDGFGEFFTDPKTGKIIFKGGGRSEPDTTQNEVDFTNYKTNAYEDFPERKPTDINTNDFRTGEDYLSKDNQPDEEVSNVFDRFKKPEDFAGGGKAEATDESGTPKVGRSRSKTNTYEELTTAAENRPADSTVDWNFQENDSHDNTSKEEGANKLVQRTRNQGERQPETPFEERIGDSEGKASDGSTLQPQEKGFYKVLGYLELNKLERDKPNESPSFSGDAKNAFKNSGRNSRDIERDRGYRAYPIDRDEIGDQPDPILSTLSDQSNADFIKFKFQALRTDDDLSSPSEQPIVFRAYINSISDSFAPSWNENNDQGRADAKIMLESWSRSISIDFIVPAMSRRDIKPIYDKLTRLAKLTYPIYPRRSGFTGTYVKTTIGDLYDGEAMYIQDLSYDWDNETPWSIDYGMQVPFYTTVSMTLGWIGKHRPDYRTNVFSTRFR